MKKTLIILILALVYFVYNKLDGSGFFKTINNNFEGSIIQVYTNMPGTEDIDVDRENGWMFISSDDRWITRKGGHTDTNGIYLFKPDSSGVPTKIETTYQGNFHPHGISYFQQDSFNYLYVINHIAKGDFVELFQYKDDTLFHIKSIENGIMCCPNDVVGIDKTHFYVTNDHGNEKGFMRRVEDYGGLAQSYLLYYDNGNFSKAVTNLQYANGVNLSNDGSQLYLTHTTGGELLILDRNKDTGALTLSRTINLKTGVDNIDVDERGNIWIGCHPKLLKFVGHSKSPRNISPSQVLKVSPSENFKVEEIYVNDGSEISGSSVAVKYKEELFIGVVFENKMLRGRLN